MTDSERLSPFTSDADRAGSRQLSPGGADTDYSMTFSPGADDMYASESFASED